MQQSSISSVAQEFACEDQKKPRSSCCGDADPNIDTLTPTRRMPGHGVDRPDQRNTNLVQLLARNDRGRHSPATRHDAEVSIFDFDGNCLSEHLMLLAPRPDIVRHSCNARLDRVGFRKVLGERGLGARCLAEPIQPNGAIVLADTTSKLVRAKFEGKSSPRNVEAYRYGVRSC